MYMHLYFYIFGNKQLLLLKIAMRTFTDYFRLHPEHLAHSNIYYSVSGFQVSLLRVVRCIIDGDPSVRF